MGLGGLRSAEARAECGSRACTPGGPPGREKWMAGSDYGSGSCLWGTEASPTGVRGSWGDEVEVVGVDSS